MTTYLDQWIGKHFLPDPPERWRWWRVGSGTLALHEDGLRLCLPRASAHSYNNAQLDDYHGLAHHHYPWRPPLRLTVRARFGGALLGTTGFGLWNHPFIQLGRGGVPVLPSAVWFFHASPPNNMALAQDVPGHGWKTATLDARQAKGWRWAPLAPAVVALNHLPAFERRVWPHVQHDLGIDEQLISATAHAWHEYTLLWRRDGVQFLIDDAVVHTTEHAPQGPLGFVAWVDNQYAVATRWGQFGYGVLLVHQPQWLDLASIKIDPL